MLQFHHWNVSTNPSEDIQYSSEMMKSDEYRANIAPFGNVVNISFLFFSFLVIRLLSAVFAWEINFLQVQMHQQKPNLSILLKPVRD